MERPTTAIERIANELRQWKYTTVFREDKLLEYVEALEADNEKLRGWSEALENLIRAAKDEYDKDPD